MWRCLSQRVLSLLVLVVVSSPARPGAFLMQQGEGQIIVNVDRSTAPQRFDGSGVARPQPTYRSTEVSGYLEFGFAPDITAIASPTVGRRTDETVFNGVSGSAGSSVGARIGLYTAPGTAISVQGLFQPARNAESASGDLRIAFGRGFTLFGLPAFVDVEPGARVRSGGRPTEARLDLAAGLRPLPNLMVLVQDFASFAGNGHGAGATPLQATGADKLQASLVIDIADRWSLQAGGFRTVLGRNAIRETGPLLGLWHRF